MLENKEKFISLCNTYIKRRGLNSLLEWLESTDFYEAPASSKYHLNVEGGLCRHSINVFECLKELIYTDRNISEYQKNEMMESAAIVALFHDLCKVDFYSISMRNVKNQYGEWIKVPYYTIDNKSLLTGHGFKSARIVNKFIDLSDEEYMAIAYHMGFSMEKPEDVSELFNKNNLAVLLHMADTKATFIIENEEKEF